MPLYFGGIPTGPDVDKLMAAFDLAPGVTAPYSEIEALIGLDRHQSRFRTITNVWRKRCLRDRGLESVAEGTAFRFLTADQALDQRVNDLHRIGRMTGRSLTKAGFIDPDSLSSPQRVEKLRLVRREAAALLAAAQASAKVIAPPGPKPSGALRIVKQKA
jgi:hypothetical protein